jgi:hypothetical protein
VSQHYAYAFDPGVWGVVRALLVVVGVLAAALMIAVVAADLRWRLRRGRRGALAAGPWSDGAPGVHLLLAGGPVRLRTPGRSVVVENGGMLAICSRRPTVADTRGYVVVAEGETLRVPASEAGHLDDDPAGGVWLYVRRRAESVDDAGARSWGTGRGSSRGPSSSGPGR